MKLQKQVTGVSLDEKKNEIINQLDSYEEKKELKQAKSKKQEKSYKSLVKTDKEYMGHPVYEIEFSNGLKILGAKVDGKLIQLKPRERLYKDVVNDRLAKWMGDSATKTRNKRRQSYWDKYGFPEVNR